jgi:Na+-transporting methylmalonyl-CoA/oxaloacetate decarboxylase gamma subunit
MASALSIAFLLVLVAAHTLVSAVLTRYFRIALDTRGGVAVFTVGGIPVVLLASTYVFSGLLGLGPELGSPAIVLTLLVAVPVGLGALVDVLYVPPPDEVELPETWE